METLVEQEEYFFFSKEIFMVMVDFGESGVRDARITMVVCRAGSDTGDRMARSTPEGQLRVGFFLKDCFLFWQSEECRAVFCVHLPCPETP